MGLWLMTEPDATVVLEAVVTAPSVSPAPVIALDAAACVRPTTFGVATCGGPEDTTNATALPVSTCVPAMGLWLMTEPDATVALEAVVTAPTVSPAPMIALDAAACVRPTTFGVATCGGPDDTTNATALPVSTCVPAMGLWLMTEPDATVVLEAVVTAPTVSPAPMIALDAATCVRPTTFGVATCGGPEDTTNATALPVSTCVPAMGLWLMTEPDATVVLEAVVTAPTVSPAP